MIFKEQMQFGILLRRYKRFLADVECENGEIITIYCPNTGSMRSCSTPGCRVCFSRSFSAGRKYPYTLEMIHEGRCWVGVNTGRTNAIVDDALRAGRIAELCPYSSVQREVKKGVASRLDFLIVQQGLPLYMEVKNCSMVENNVAMFPDAVTARGTKHLKVLEDCVRQGLRGVLFFLVQRTDCDSFTPAAHIDPLYAETLRDVYNQGVEILVYQAEVTPAAIEVRRKLPFFL